MENNKKEIYETSDNTPIEAEDFSPDSHREENGQEENGEESIPVSHG